jgi:HKD family nuclease
MTPSVGFYGQPYNDERTVGAFLRRVLTAEDLSELTVVVAWARFRGLRRIKEELTGFCARGGRARIILGIDEGVATRPGLLLARELFSEAYVLHDRPGITYHPKMYLAEGHARAALLVGSGNLTAGGLFSNYEAAVEVEFALPAEANEQALAEARTYVDRLLGDEEICLRLDKALIDRLVKDRRYAVAGREIRSRRPDEQLPAGVEPEDVDPTGEAEAPQFGGASLFGASKHDKVSVPALPPEAREELRALEIDLEAENGAIGNPRPTPAGASLGPPFAPPESVFVAELSKSRGAEQANIHLQHYEGYFGARKGSRRTIVLKPVLDDGTLGEDEPRGSIEVASQNYRFELAGLKGRAYPAGNLTPIAVFVQTAETTFIYRVLWPDAPGHQNMTDFLTSKDGPRVGRRRMRQVRATMDELEEAWPQNPLLKGGRQLNARSSQPSPGY